MKQILGLIGKNISYSLSPDIHNFSSTKLGISSSYQIYETKHLRAFENFLISFRKQGGIGLNITSPYKVDILKYINNNDGLISANVLFVLKDGEWRAACTDGEGFARAVKRKWNSLLNFEHLIFLGNGGVVCSILSYLQRNKYRGKISIIRRNKAKDSDLIRYFFRLNISFYTFLASSCQSLFQGSNSQTLLIQSIPAQVWSQQQLIESNLLKFYRGSFIDLCYNPCSRLFHELSSLSVVCEDGLSMLIEQAILSQELWWQRSLSYSIIDEHIRNICS